METRSKKKKGYDINKAQRRRMRDRGEQVRRDALAIATAEDSPFFDRSGLALAMLMNNVIADVAEQYSLVRALQSEAKNGKNTFATDLKTEERRLTRMVEKREEVFSKVNEALAEGEEMMREVQAILQAALKQTAPATQKPSERARPAQPDRKRATQSATPSPRAVRAQR